MTTRTQPYDETDAHDSPERRKKERQLIGIARRALQVSDDAHAALVTRVTAGRATSTLECDLRELLAIKGHYRACGWKPTPHKGAPRPLRGGVLQQASGNGPQLAKIGALLTTQNRPWSYAVAIYRRQQGLPPDTLAPLELATATALQAVIAALSRHQKRQAAGGGK